MFHKKEEMIIVVGTTSAIKIAAVQTVFPNAKVIGVKTASGVPEQPVEAETERGAINRVNAARVAMPLADLFIAIESGIFNENGHYIDRAVVVVVDKAGIQHIAVSEGVEFPKVSFEKAQTRGFDKVTVGQVMFEDGLVKVKDDPHADLGKKIPRAELLQQTISAAYLHRTTFQEILISGNQPHKGL